MGIVDCAVPRAAGSKLQRGRIYKCSAVAQEELLSCFLLVGQALHNLHERKHELDRGGGLEWGEAQ